MFHKENSSVGSTKSKKKSMDVPLKKSQRRQLRAIAAEWFGLLLVLHDNNKDDDGGNDATTNTNSMLDQAFLHGTLMQRKVLNNQDQKVTLYLRSPNNTNNINDNRHNDEWPYTSSTQIIWMSFEDNNNNNMIYAPTVALLAVLMPHIMTTNTILIPTVTIASHVSKYLCRGAHLMRAGITSISVPPTNNNNNIVAICVSGNPQPMAVGRFLTSNTTTISMDSIGPGTKGIGVEIYTCYGDDLWRNQQLQKKSYSDTSFQLGIINPIGGAPYDNGHYGNVGFVEGKCVVPITSTTLDAQNEDNTEHHVETNLADSPTKEASPSTAAADDDDESVEDNEKTLQQQQQDKEDSPSEKNVDDDQQKDGHDDNGSTSTTNPHDVLLHQAVCWALVSLKKLDLPITVANFYAQHVLKQHSAEQSIQLKCTSWKKLGPYLTEQVERELLMVGPGKDKNNKDPMAYLMSVNKGHFDLKSLRQEQQSGSTTSMDDTIKKKKKMAIVNLYRVPQFVVNLMQLNMDDVQAMHAKSPERRGTGMLTTPEVRAILQDYIAKNELVDAMQPNVVIVDGPLCDVLYKKDNKYPTRVSQKELHTKWLARMEPAYALVEMPGNCIAKLSKGLPPKVLLEVSMRQGKKKFVTRIRGLEEYGIDPNYFSKDVAKRFACSATVETNPTGRAALKKGHVELVFQGRLDDELRALLLGDERLSSHGGVKGGDYCLPKNAIEVTLKKGVSAKEKH